MLIQLAVLFAGCPALTNAGSTTSCNDDSACTTDDHCDGLGSCVGGNTVTCATPPLCKVQGPCNPGTGKSPEFCFYVVTGVLIVKH